MATEKQIEANRANAQSSQGPTSPTGKEAVSQNATTHGLTGRFIFFLERDHEIYNNMLKLLEEQLNAQSLLEQEIVEKMCQSLWRARRAVDLQDECIDTLAFHTDEELTKEAHKRLELYLRYQTTHDRAYQRYAAELRKFQSEKQKAEIGFVSQQRSEAGEKRAQAQEIRREDKEVRTRERHETDLQLTLARFEHQNLLNRKLVASLFPLERPEVQPSVAQKAA